MFCTKINRASLFIFSVVLVSPQWAAAQAGSLDPSFGNGGIVTTDFGDESNSNKASANAVTVQPDGKIVVGGGIPSSTGFPVPAVARYNTNGSLDTTFGINGIASIASIEDIPITAVTVQSDGKIVAVGGGFDAFVARYTSSGVLDSMFGTGGVVSLNFNAGPSGAGVVEQSNGDILVANGKLIRLLSNGQLDTSFGTGGSARTAGFAATSLALLPSGEILASSSSSGGGFISEYQANGSLDTTFGIGGQLATPGTAPGLALLSTGEFLAGGTLTNNVPLPLSGLALSGFAVSRYLGVGIADATFGTNGGTVTSLASYPRIVASGLAVQPSGDVIIVGTGNLLEQTAFTLARYTPGGQLDTTFGNNGAVVTSFGIAANVSANALAIQSDGKIVVVGSYLITVPHGLFDTAFKITRYLNQ